jgi:hypothetical protein
VLDGGTDAGAFQRHDALVALAAFGLQGQRQMTGAEQPRQVAVLDLALPAGQPAHRALVRALDHQRADRAAALRLQRQPALELECRGEHQHRDQALAEGPLDRLGVGVAAKHGLEGRIEADQFTAHAEALKDESVQGVWLQRAHGRSVSAGWGARGPAVVPWRAAR